MVNCTKNITGVITVYINGIYGYWTKVLTAFRENGTDFIKEECHAHGFILSTKPISSSHTYLQNEKFVWWTFYFHKTVVKNVPLVPYHDFLHHF